MNLGQTAMQTRHFVLTPDGHVREFTPEQAASVASGLSLLPEFARRRIRYLQVNIADSGENLQVQTAGACIEFDDQGRLSSAGPPANEKERISGFEHEACVQWVLKSLPAAPVVFH